MKVFVSVFLAVVLGSTATGQNNLKISHDEILSIAREAYFYGLPAVFTDFTRQVSGRPNNVYTHSRKFPDHNSRLVVRPNNDTNYSSAFLDLGSEPVVLILPDTKERYYVTPLMDAWTNVFASFGKRNTGTGPQQYVITGPHWKGKLPKDIKEVKSPTDLVWVIGRIQVNSPEDQKDFVSPLQDKFKIYTLSKWQKGDTSVTTSVTSYKTPLPLDDVRSRKVTVVKAIREISTENYFNYLNELLVKNPGLPDDAPALKRFASIGIKPGETFSLSSFDAETRKALEELPAQIYAAFDNQKKADKLKSEAGINSVVGHYGTDYVKRAYIAYYGLGALPPEDAIYTGYSEDSEYEILNGKTGRYRIHFEKGKTPPARAFWSLTLYDKDGYLAENSIRRYAIGDRNPLKYNPDGSLDIYIQHENPGPENTDNWLPAPEDVFSLSIRIYWPTEAYLKDQSLWNKPDLQKVK